MSFPHHDRNLTEAADFLRAHIGSGESILAPDIFWWMFDRIFRYLNTFRNPCVDYDFAVVHKGEVARLEPSVLRRTLARGRCVFAIGFRNLVTACVLPHFIALRPLGLSARLPALTARPSAGASGGSDETVLPDRVIRVQIVGFRG
jgi:hypothetical protein